MTSLRGRQGGNGSGRYDEEKTRPMCFPSTDMSLPRPGGAAAIYGKVLRETENPRQIEIRIFEQVTADLEAAEQPDVAFPKRIAAIHRNRQLWLTLTCDLADDRNGLPEQLRARLISIALWVFGETRRLTTEGASLANLVAVNRSIMNGLAMASEGAT
jgi:flagellar protein FlaF